jgi:RNA-directed DNA polymerase
VLAKVTITDMAHGFVADRSIVTNARPHLHASVVVNLDLKDFFPTLGFRRIKGMFEGLGYGEEAASIFALLTSEPDIEDVELDGVRYFVAHSARKLPQGSPASPAVTNIVCRRLDKRLGGMAKRLGFAYTRYADDLTFSSATKPAEGEVGKLLRRARWIVKQEGFSEHEKKTRILRRGRRQEVTGVVVNDKASVPRDVLKRFRAVLYQVHKDGPKGKRWGNREGDAVLASLVGFASYVAMVDPEKGKPLLATSREVALRHGWQPAKPPVRRAAPGASSGGPVAPHAEPVGGPPSPEAPAPGATEPKKKKWWQIF